MIRDVVLSNGLKICITLPDSYANNMAYNTNEYFASITFITNDIKYIVANDVVSYLAESFLNALRRADDLTLASSIKDDIGKCYNEYLHAVDEETDIADLENNKIWSGYTYFIFETKQNVTWLYKMNGRIYLELSPIFPYHFVEYENSEQKHNLYQSFLSKYSTILRIEITREDIEVLITFFEQFYV